MGPESEVPHGRKQLPHPPLSWAGWWVAVGWVRVRVRAGWLGKGKGWLAGLGNWFRLGPSRALLLLGPSGALLLLGSPPEPYSYSGASKALLWASGSLLWTSKPYCGPPVPYSYWGPSGSLLLLRGPPGPYSYCGASGTLLWASGSLPCNAPHGGRNQSEFAALSHVCWMAL